MKVVVLGATGHLGAYTAQRLLDEGHAVTAVGRRMSDNAFFASIGAEYVGGVSLEDPEAFNRLPQGGVDAVVHLAGAMPAHAGTSPLPYVRSIVEGMVNVCEWMTRIGCRRIVFNTTPSDVAPAFPRGAVSEDEPRSFPHDGGDHAVYAIAKNAAVDILEHYRIASGILPCVFRHMTVYGWHPDPYYFKDGVRRIKPYCKILQDVLAGGPVEVWGNPKAQKELLYIKDFTDAVARALERSTVCGLFNLPGFRHYTTEEQIDGFISAFAPGAIRKVYLPEKPSSPEQRLRLGGAKTLLGWEPKFTWEAACRDWAREAQEAPFLQLWSAPSTPPTEPRV